MGSGLVLLFSNFLELFIESAPFLLLGFAVAGLIKVCIPKNFLIKHLGAHGWKSTIKAAFIGTPLPLCSCGVVPAAIGLRKAGASKNATISFLVATPETGFDSIAISYALLGPFLAIIRPIAAIFSAIASGLLVGKTDNAAVTQNNQTATPHKHCCNTNKNGNASFKTSKHRSLLYKGLHFSFVKMLNDVSLWLVVGLLFAAAVETWLPSDFLHEWGSGFFAFVIMALIGVPMYICASASTPIAAGLLLAGISPGAVLVFMLAGPATNIGTLVIIFRELGKNALTAYLLGIVLVSFIFGFITNYLAEVYHINVTYYVQNNDYLTQNIIAQLSAVLLTILMVNAFYLDFKNKLLSRK